jgi:hypothetical protein
MGLSSEVVYFVGTNVIDERRQLLRIRQISVMEVKPHVGTVRVLIEMIDPAGVETARPSDETVDFIALREEEFREI